MNRNFDLVVMGAGPAGGEAALAASEAGLNVALVDEGLAPGGQVWRKPSTDRACELDTCDVDRTGGDELRKRLAASKVTIYQQTQIWDVRSGFSISCVGDAGAMILSTPRIVVATGAIERVLPFEGWTTPGVFGLAAATALLKSEKALPGSEIVVAGQGPLLIAVAAKACALGLRPRAIVDMASRADWARALTGFAMVPSLLLMGTLWMKKIVAARVPFYRGSEVIQASGGEALRLVTIRNRATGNTTDVQADTLYIGNGLSPNDEIYRLLGARQEIDSLRGGYRVVCDANRRSSISGLYAAGDSAGIHGARPSALQGRLAGLAAAYDHGALNVAKFSKLSRSARLRLRLAMPFANASCRLMQFPEKALGHVAEETVVCRCEDVTAGDILVAARCGVRDINQLKHFTRLGMGPCQARLCAMNAAVLLRRHTESSSDTSRLTPRAPIRPIAMDQLIGEFDYSDIPVPRPAPL